MSTRQLAYFILLGGLFGLLVISLEIRIISQARFEWENNPATGLFLSGFPWYAGAHLLLSLVVTGVLWLGFKFFSGFYKKWLVGLSWHVWGLYLLLFLDLFLIGSLIFSQRFFFRSAMFGWMLSGLIFLGVVACLTLIPCVFLNLFFNTRARLKLSLLLIFLSSISFTIITWLHQQEVVVTQQIPLTSQVFSLEALIWFAEGFLLSCLALLLVFLVEYGMRHVISKDFITSSITALLFLILVISLLWIWILAWKPEQTGFSLDRKPPPGSTNVMQIVIDTLGGKYLDPDQLERYPGFSELARDGFQFTRAYSTASCTSWSVPAILTSSFKFINSGRQFDEFGWLDENELTTAEILKEAGLETIGFSANPVTSEAFDFDQGFAYFRGIKGSNLLGVYILKALGTQRTKFAYQYGLVDSGLYYQDIKNLYYKLESYLSQNHVRPFYIYVQTMDLHAPYMPPKEYLDVNFRFDDFRSHWELAAMRKTGRIKDVADNIKNNTLQLYLGELRYTDEYLGKLIQLLKRSNLYDNTLIIITSDHGEEFWEHDSYAHCSVEAYDELIRVPLFIKPPGSLAPESNGSVIEENVSTLDILPTIIDLAKINLASSEKGRFEGRSLLPLILRKTDDMNQRMLYGVERSLYFAIQKRWKLLWRGKAGKFELYDLERDPVERENVFFLRQSNVKDEALKLSVFASNFSSETEYEKGDQKLDPNLEEKLRSLGYIQ